MGSLPATSIRSLAYSVARTPEQSTPLQRFDLGPGDRLPIGDQRQRLQRRAGEPRLPVESEEAANIRRKPGRRGEVRRAPVPDHDPAPRGVVVERGQRLFDRGDGNTGRVGEITKVSRLRRHEQQRFEQRGKLVDDPR